MKSTLKKVWHDLLICLLWALVASAVTAAIGAVIGLFIYDPNEVPFRAFQGVVSGLMVVGALSMLCSAFMFTRHARSDMRTEERKKEEKLTVFWKEKFLCLSQQAGFLIISVIMLIIGCVLERVLYAVR